MVLKSYVLKLFLRKVYENQQICVIFSKIFYFWCCFLCFVSCKYKFSNLSICICASLCFGLGKPKSLDCYASIYFCGSTFFAYTRKCDLYARVLFLTSCTIFCACNHQKKYASMGVFSLCNSRSDCKSCLPTFVKHSSNFVLCKFDFGTFVYVCVHDCWRSDFNKGFHKQTHCP